MVRDVIPYIFWPWMGISVMVLLRRRMSQGRWRAKAPQETPAAVEFPPPPPLPVNASFAELPTASRLTPARADDNERNERDEAEPAPAPAPVAVMETVDPDRPRARSLAAAVEGISMPCDLAPLMGTGTPDPHEVAFFTHGHAPVAVGSALSDEFERLGYAITPLDDRSILAERGPDAVEARLLSTALTSAEVMQELYPSAPVDALVVALKLT